MKILTHFFEDFISLLYPRLCFACDEPLLKHEKFFCTDCWYNFPRTNFHLVENNPVANQFYGKINFNAAASFFYFSKGGKVQHVVHQLKYKGYKNIGLFTGQKYGEELLKSQFYSSVDVIIPIPLHPKKLRQRGYNQAECFALGLSQSMKVPVNTSTLLRSAYSETQTHKNRFSRWENVKGIFEVRNGDLLIGKHILLVDDVITTGSTLEAAGHALFKIADVRISVASLACALH